LALDQQLGKWLNLYYLNGNKIIEEASVANQTALIYIIRYPDNPPFKQGEP
jgi:hypothetical protein